jgi:hypothetical protein
MSGSEVRTVSTPGHEPEYLRRVNLVGCTLLRLTVGPLQYLKTALGPATVKNVI